MRRHVRWSMSLPHSWLVTLCKLVNIWPDCHACECVSLLKTFGVEGSLWHDLLTLLLRVLVCLVGVFGRVFCSVRMF
jgi:hypothetical protein